MEKLSIFLREIYVDHIAILCKTAEEERAVLDILFDLGYQWLGGEPRDYSWITGDRGWKQAGIFIDSSTYKLTVSDDPRKYRAATEFLRFSRPAIQQDALLELIQGA